MRGVLGLLVLSAAAPSARSSIYVDVEKEVARARRDLTDAAEKRRYWATVILGRYPDAAIDAVSDLAEALKDVSPRVRAGAALALREFGPRAARESSEALVSALADDSPDVRASVAFALAEVGARTRAAFGPLLAGLTSPSLEEHVASALALTRLYPAEATRAFDAPLLALDGLNLLQSAMDDDDGVRPMRYGRALAFLDPDLAYVTAIRFVELHPREGGSNVDYASRSLEPALSARVPSFLSALRSGAPGARLRSARILGILGVGSPVVVRALTAGLSADRETAEACARALGRIGEKAVFSVPRLSTVALRAGGTLRESAAMALFAISRPDAERVHGELIEVDSEFAAWYRALMVLSDL